MEIVPFESQCFSSGIIACVDDFIIFSYSDSNDSGKLAGIPEEWPSRATNARCTYLTEIYYKNYNPPLYIHALFGLHVFM